MKYKFFKKSYPQEGKFEVLQSRSYILPKEKLKKQS